jgi:hypothetical protein
MEESIIIPDNLPIPDFNPDRQYLGEPVYDGKEWSFPVINYSDIQIKSIEVQKAEFQRQSGLKLESEKRIVSSLQLLSNTEAIEKKAMYPIWEKLEEGYSFKTIGEKFQSFDEKKELGLYSVLQPHTKQSIFPPLIIPALWNQIKMQGSIEVWTQQTGNTGKYPYKDPLTDKPYVVSHKGLLWENTVTGTLNIWEPSVFGWKQI